MAEVLPGEVEKSSESRSGFLGRMETIVHLAGNAERLAKLSGITPSGVGKYLKGKSDPSRERLIKMAKAVGVTVEWLATGEGPMRIGEEKPEPAAGSKPGEPDQPPIDPEALEAIIQILDDVQDEYHLRFSAQKKAQIILAAWDVWISLPEDNRNMEMLGKLIKSAA